jgi:TonB family protein
MVDSMSLGLRKRVPVFLVASLGVHAILLASLPAEVPSAQDLVEVVLQAADGPSAGAQAAGTPGTEQRGDTSRRAMALDDVRLPVLAESRASSALDHGAPGRAETSGGTISILLADRDQDITVAEQLPNHASVSQLQRIRTAPDRSSLIDDRLTPNPADATTLTSGRGTVRREVRARAANAASGVSTEALAVASSPAPEEPAHARDYEGPGGEGASPPPPPTPAPAGAAEEVPMRQGIAGGGGDGPPVNGAAVAFARPDLHRGRPAVPSQERDGRLRDNRWSELLVSTLRTGWTTASDPGGGAGPGQGASEGGPGAGRRGEGDGGRSAAGAGEGEETWISLNTPDPRFMAFFRDIHRKVDPLWRNAFPREAALALEQGTCIVGFTVHRNGTVTGVHVRRRSGFPEFDQRVRDAILRAAPFSPIPSSLGVDRLLVTAPFEFSNPLFR